MYDDSSFTASNRQLEIVARENEIEKLNNEMATLRGERREIDRRSQELGAESQAAREALKAEQERALALEGRIERLLPDRRRPRREDRPRRTRGGARCATPSRQSSGTEGELQAQLAALQSEKTKLDSEKAGDRRPTRHLHDGRKLKEMEKLMAKVSADRDLLEERLKILTRENRKLKVDVAVHERTESEEWSGERRQSAILREQMNELAAEGGQASPQHSKGRTRRSTRRSARPARPTTIPARRSPALPTRCARCRRRRRAG